MRVHEQGKVHAPEFASGLTWLQSEPLTLRALRGKVVLVDFWSYACINCVRTFPHLIRWHKAYAEKGLVIIGVHTPEFVFEHEQAHVADAIRRFALPYPVVLDNDYVMWRAYANRSWPHAYVINAQGTIVYDHAGEGGYAATELALQEALLSAGATNLPAIGPDGHEGGRVCYRTTPEHYLGFLRGDIANIAHALPGSEIACTDSGDGDVAVHGHWAVHDEYVEHTRNTSGFLEYLRVHYEAFSVQMVMASAQNKHVAVEVRLNGAPIPPDMRGKDVHEEGGKTYIWIDAPRMYALVQAGVHHEGDVRVYAASAGVRLYSATFGGCEE